MPIMIGLAGGIVVFAEPAADYWFRIVNAG
jgi:hypothetical protein